MGRLRGAVAANPDAGLTEVSRTLGMGQRTLQQHLREDGTSFARERLELRMARASELLARGDEKVDAVARASGFRSTSHFARAFKVRFGHTPRRLSI